MVRCAHLIVETIFINGWLCPTRKNKGDIRNVQTTRKHID